MYIVSGLAVTVAFFFGTQGQPTRVEVAGTPVPVAGFIATHGPIPAQASANARDVAYVFSGTNAGMIWEVRPAGSDWSEFRKGGRTPWPVGTNQKFRVVTLELSLAEISRLEGTFRPWNKINNVKNPTSIVAPQPTATPTFTPTP